MPVASYMDMGYVIGHLVLMLGVCLWHFVCLGVYFIAKKLKIMRMVNQLFIRGNEKKRRYVMEECFGRSD